MAKDIFDIIDEMGEEASDASMGSKDEQIEFIGKKLPGFQKEIIMWWKHYVSYEIGTGNEHIEYQPSLEYVPPKRRTIKRSFFNKVVIFLDIIQRVLISCRKLL